MKTGEPRAQGNEIPKRTDVLIVGAGPTGLSLACALAQRGIDHVIIDHAPQVPANGEAVLVDVRTLEALESIDVSGSLIRRGITVSQFTLRDGDDALLTVAFSELSSKYPYLLVVPESTAEAVLFERLASHRSSVLRPVTAVALEEQTDGVTVELWDGSTSRSGGPARRSIVARYVVGCDGRHSQIRSALEIPFVGPPNGDFFLIADVRMFWSLPRSEVQLFVSEDGLLVVAPLPEDRYRIVATVEHDIAQPGPGDLQKILATRGPRASPARLRDLVWSTGFRTHPRLAMHYRSGRVFLAGDAAHVQSPAAGQGMNAGIQDAIHLADKLADVLAGRASDAVLNHYEDERRPVAESVLQLTRRLSAMATMRGQTAPRVRNWALLFAGRLPALRRALASRLAGIEWSRRSRGGRDHRRLLYVATLVLVTLLLGSSCLWVFLPGVPATEVQVLPS